MNMQEAKRSVASRYPKTRLVDGKRWLLSLSHALVLAALVSGCGASFRKTDALTSEDLKDAQGEAERRVQAGQRLKILRSQMAGTTPTKDESPGAAEAAEAAANTAQEPKAPADPAPTPDSE